MSKQLCINITGTSAYFAEVLRSSKEIIREVTLNFKSHKDYEIKEELNVFLEQENLKQDYDEYSLAYWTNYFTIIPFNVLDSQDYSNVFELTFGNKLNKSDIDYNLLPHLGISNVFHIPHWVKSFFIVKYPRIVLQHANSIILNGMNEGSNFKPNVLIHLDYNNFYINIFANNELKFSNSYEFQNEDDVIYHTLFVLQKMELTGDKGQVNISSFKNTEKITPLLNKFKNFLELKQFKIEENQNQIINNHLLCV